MPWDPDLLDGYVSTEIALPDAARYPGEPEDVEVVATLVRRDAPSPSRRAVLYVHGWNDYFFQTHLADHWAGLGFDFYALDLRRYGRSARVGHLRGFTTDLGDYDAELDAAAELIRAEHDQLVVMGHSTGGLVTSLWAARRPGVVDALVLNSPWLDLQGSALVRALGAPVIDALGARNPYAVLRAADPGHYARTLHRTLEGEWDYDLDMKLSPGPPIRVGWLRAVLQGQRRVAAGLGIEVPVLTLASTRTSFARRWSEDLRVVDTVLDVEQIAARAVRLGRSVTVVRVEDGMHDLVLSAPAVRQQVLEEMSRFVHGYVPETAA
ncbi:Lysophospholipase, alpha-beta hydrolase superfamily [Microlunatus sagamiharensis]|uniref:Lysophospholipase, alpha-beta hydrolase superfamily n=1 Tax=Microlunatus sagamiharensis TaxID=546874 RepID=A0A1H2N026_9ACTN|nr:alpha/beta hydrolase [Microlunatus sagamiharensis]SDU98839.1 Lysophospholipase, alpha-beta hydrolase superfamily [Microlunatus sagamiharensis]